MPQITLEHSTHFDKADFRKLALEIHDLCALHVGATLESCKTRIVKAENLVIADGAPEQAMAHCDLRILSGRTQEQKTALGQAVQQTMVAALTQYDGPRQISVEIVDLDKPNYHKVTAG
ncbi:MULTISPECIES: 5-carboxymethyl-2-hydroxymuconate Delta-isomerase [unclassified Brevundimonas]|uniref:5-carboxymethyl-2-hydroxymuconate Delta-isomerase n=1 Tax=unclassified Brevundimonas TaxID=2622653 RepID=UPI0025C11E63|nr:MULTISPECIES: isomerase [unclassified Brevundimonas]